MTLESYAASATPRSEKDLSQKDTAHTLHDLKTVIRRDLKLIDEEMHSSAKRMGKFYGQNLGCLRE